MNGLHVGNLRSTNNGRDIEITLAGGGLTDADGVIRKTNVKAVPVCLRVNYHGLDSHFSAGPDHPHSNFPAISD
jgi:hypothetical protein